MRIMITKSFPYLRCYATPLLQIPRAYQTLSGSCSTHHTFFSLEQHSLLFWISVEQGYLGITVDCLHSLYIFSIRPKYRRLICLNRLTHLSPFACLFLFHSCKRADRTREGPRGSTMKSFVQRPPLY